MFDPERRPRLQGDPFEERTHEGHPGRASPSQYRGYRLALHPVLGIRRDHDPHVLDAGFPDDPADPETIGVNGGDPGSFARRMPQPGLAQRDLSDIKRARDQ